MCCQFLHKSKDAEGLPKALRPELFTWEAEMSHMRICFESTSTTVCKTAAEIANWNERGLVLCGMWETVSCTGKLK